MIGPVITAHPSAARTATGQTPGFVAPGGASRVAVLVDATSVSGVSPSMTLSVEWSNDGTAWAVGDTADTFAAITAAATKVKEFVVKGAQFRLVYTISGTTPSFTFAATATGQV